MGAAFNNLMEEETKESLAELCCKLMDEIATLKNDTACAKTGRLEIESRHSDYGEDAGGYRVLRLDGKYVGRVEDYAVGKELLKAFNAMAEEITMLKTHVYPHMCRDEHEQIGHSDSENERCPLCRAQDEIVTLKSDRTLVVTTPFPFLHSDFLTLMNDIGRHGYEKYGDRIAEFTTRKPGARWESAAVAQHAQEHVVAYLQGVPHDHFGTTKHQLAAAAFNAMLEFIFSQGE